MDFEKLGAFYLGRPYDPDTKAVGDQPLLYDARHLTTHAVCVGMTGSGKTGLCLSLLEEAAIDGVPALAIDPKGDLGNLLLTFPELRAEDFRPWVDEGEATREGRTLDAHAEAEAARWRDGLLASGQDGARIRRLRETADLAIYTPGSAAGRPLSLLRSFTAPAPALLDDPDALRERVVGAASGLLALLGLDADPIRSREHILVATILQHAWQAGRDIDLAGLIGALQDPPFERVGVVDLETFFPKRDRRALALELNNLLASPGFAAWMEGEPLDIPRLLWTPDGRPRIAILSIAHLSDAERMFFVTMLLEEVLAWVRAQPGTTSLRALLYMDEVFGYFPPTAAPPSKRPMLTLLKQARAFGLGVVLATQNPVDLDYKGLSNAGTWFIGRLQTERDQRRVLDGLEGAASASGGGFDRRRMETLLAGLGNRVFLLNDVHAEAPTLFQVRWTLSYLRGPLTRAQIRRLVPPVAAPVARPAPRVEVTMAAAAVAPAAPVAAAAAMSVAADLSEELLASGPAEGPRCWAPAALGVARVHFHAKAHGLDHWQDVAVRAPLDGASDDPWAAAEVLDGPPASTPGSPPAADERGPLPTDAARTGAGARWTKGLQRLLAEHAQVALWTCPALDAASRMGESEADFRARLALLARERRDREVEAVRGRFGPRIARLEERLRKARARVDEERLEAELAETRANVDLGSAALGALFGRGPGIASLARAAGGGSRVAKEQAEARRAEAELETIRSEVRALAGELDRELTRVRTGLDPATLAVETAVVRPRPQDIEVERVVLLWTPA